MERVKHWFACGVSTILCACGDGGRPAEIVYRDRIVSVGPTETNANDAGMPETTRSDGAQPEDQSDAPPIEGAPDAGAPALDPPSACDPPCANGMTCYEGQCRPPARYDNWEEYNPEGAEYRTIPNAAPWCQEVTFAVVNRPSSILLALTDISALVREAIRAWGAVTCIGAREVSPERAGDAMLVVRFASGDHGDVGCTDCAFDGISGVLCHAFPDTPYWRSVGLAGEIHCDDAEPWAPFGSPLGFPFDLQSALTHEAGHVLGLDHTTIEGAVMWPSYNGQRAPQPDDVAGIQSLCGAPTACAGTPPAANRPPVVTATPTAVVIAVGEVARLRLTCTDGDPGDACTRTWCTAGSESADGPDVAIRGVAVGTVAVSCFGQDTHGAMSAPAIATITVRESTPTNDRDGDGVTDASDCDPDRAAVGATSSRSCQTTCGTGTERCTDGRWAACDAPIPNACGTCAASRECANECGNRGTQQCVGTQWSPCNAATCERCGNGQCGSGETCASCAGDCGACPICRDGETRACSTACGSGTERCSSGRWNGICDGPQPNVCGTCELTRPCSTACGSGTERCDSGRWAACSAPATCCGDGTCNEDRASCRVDCPIRCGDGTCDSGESCTADCGECTDGVTRSCTAPCGPGTERCANRRWSGTCDGPQRNSCGTCEDTRACSTPCGSGSEQCVSGQWSGCTAQQPNSCGACSDARACRTSCGNGTEQCIGGVWAGCTAAQPNGCGTCTASRECANECGDRGTQQCVGSQWSGCTAAICEECRNGRCAGSETHASCPQDCNRAPVISGTTCAATAIVGEIVTYATTGYDPDGDTVTCRWTDDYGNAVDGCVVRVSWRSAGSFRITVTARDPYNGSATASCTTMVQSPPPETCNGVDDDRDGQTDENLQDIGECGAGNCSAGACNNSRDTACNIGERSDHDDRNDSFTHRLLTNDADVWRTHVTDTFEGRFDPNASATLPSGVTAQLCLRYRRDDGRAYTPPCTSGDGASFGDGSTGCCQSGTGTLSVRWLIDSYPWEDPVGAGLDNATGTFWLSVIVTSGGSCGNATTAVEF